MSLHKLANHMSAQGRGPDSTLVHMSPREVHGLQALALANGQSLTINPDTGLPEAGALDKFLPALAGFALDAFVPGAGSAVGGFLGLEGALASSVGTGLLVGGAAGLASGSLEQGLMAGLGAYGGAGLSQGLGSMGSAANARAANAAAQAAGLEDIDRVAAINAAAKPDIAAGIREAAINPYDALKDNKYAIGSALLPGLMDTGGQGGVAPLKNSGNIRRYEKNPVTGALEQVEVVPVDEFGSRSAVTFGGVGQPVRYDEGGVVEDMPKIKPDPYTGGYFVRNDLTQKYDYVNANGVTTPASALNASGAPAVKFGGVPRRAPMMRDPNDTRTDSQKAYDYLMGVPGAKNPMLFYHDQGDGTKAPADALAPFDLNTRTGGHYVINKDTGTYDWVPNADAGLAAIADQRGGGGGRDANSAGAVGGGFPAALAPAALTVASTLSNLGLNDLSAGVSLAAMDGAFSGSGAAPGSSYGPDPGAVNGGESGGWGSRDAGGGIQPGSSTPGAVGGYGGNAQAGAAAAAGTVGGYGPGTPGFNGGMVGGVPSGSDISSGGGDPGATGRDAGAVNSGVNGGWGSRDAGGYTGGDGGGEGAGSGGGRYAAQGGLMALAGGGMSNLGGYSDGGRLLRGPGDGVSDSIPATIGKGQPARLADGEFVIPARIVSELGNGSTEAGAKQLYAMMARVQAGRAKTTGKNQVAKNSKAVRHLPA